MDLGKIADKAAGQLGYRVLKEKQKEAFVAILCGCDVFVVLPTGYRKSVIFGCLLVSLILLHKEKPIVLVTAPLTALMKDQVCHIALNNYVTLLHFDKYTSDNPKY